jgi:membrane protein
VSAAGYTRIIVRSFFDFFRDGGMMLAASLSYFSMMAIVPFCLFLVTIFGYFLGGQREFYQFFSARLISYFPDVTRGITEELGRIITYKGLGKLSLLLYGLLSYGLFSSLEAATNTIFKIKVKRSFLVSVILSLVIVTSIIAFFLISFGATSMISALKPVQEFFPGLKIGRISGLLIRFVLPFFVMFVTVTMLYVFLPKKRIRTANALSGALFTVVFLEAAKHLFTLYVVNVFRLGTIYGPLSAFVIFLLWVFYSASIFLIGAEVVHNLEGRKGG